MRSRVLAIPILLLAIIVQGVEALGVRYEPTREYYSPGEESPALSIIKTANPKVLTHRSTLHTDTSIIDFEKRQISFERCDLLGFTVGSCHYEELGQYLLDRRSLAVERMWSQNSQFAASAAEAQAQSSDLKLQWEMPIQYPGWAQRVLGNEPPRLSITGSIRIKMAYEDVRLKESAAWTQSQSAAPGFNFEQTNQFNITGSVGRLISLNISANSEDGVSADDPLKKMKIDYQESRPGELEDEVVQQVTAGYTGFSMPGTQLSGYSESKEGLFGIKIASKFGPLTLTTIASTEQGETQKLSVSNSGRANAGKTSATGEGQFKQDRYFFLDTTYISWYNKKYAIKGGSVSVSLPDSLEVKELEVWKEIRREDETGLTSGDISRRYDTLHINDTLQQGNFLLLRPDRDYKLFPKEGYVRFFDEAQIQPNNRIGIYLRTGSPALSKGGKKILLPKGDSVPSFLWMLRSEDPSRESLKGEPERFRLMWRNVYEIGGITEIAGFIFNIYSVPSSKPDTSKTIGGKDITEIMGLAKGGTLFTERQDIFNFETRELVIPPYGTNPDGNNPFSNPDLGENVDTMIYRFGSATNEMISHKEVFSIEMSGTSKQKNFNLDIGVMENSVIVKADGKRLTKDVDYYLNTDVGSLELISPFALNAEKIDIEYQREALFVPERKVFLGARGEMQLPFISDKSFMGLSILYQGTNINQKVPRINQEPFQKFLFDFNTKLDFQPDWMTRAVNTIPLVKTDATSNATVEFEVAHSRMNPNTENQAYVDDFESIKQTYELGNSYRSWYPASPPWEYRDSLASYPPAWDWYWFQPVNQDETNRVRRDSIWRLTENERLTGSEQYESVMRLHVKPSPDDPSLSARFGKSWAGIMTPVPVGQKDRKRDQYFEIMVKVVGGAAGRGKLRVQMGKMREDICVAGAPPNRRENKEDTSRIWRDTRDAALDRGLDTLSDQKEFYQIPDGIGGWESLSYGDARLGEWKFDPSKDNFRIYNDATDKDNWKNYKYACRLEKDGSAMSTEDINSDGTVETSTQEQYHEFIIDFADTNSPYIDHTAESKLVDKAWRRYRFPLHEKIVYKDTIRRDVNFDSTKADDWTNIRAVRLIWDGITYLSEENQLILSSMQFVGNQWEAIRDARGKSNVDVSVIGTRENLPYEISVRPLVLDRIPRQTNEQNGYQPEQSLRLNFHNIGPGQVCLAQRNYSYQKLDLASYENLTIEVHGMDTTRPGAAGVLCNGEAKVTVRFGADTTTYYEYRQKINAGWNNLIHINLKEFSKLKNKKMGGPADSLNAWSDDSTLHIKAPKGRQPSFSNIIWMAVGVVRDNASADSSMLDGLELWVNELKVVGIKQFNGWSSRLNLTTQWADFLSLSGDLTYQGGDFRTMTENDIKLGDSRLSSNINLSTGLDKFMPREWGVAMPVGGSITTSLTRPQLRPNTDINLTDDGGNPDGFIEMVKDVMSGSKRGDSATESEHFETQSYGQSIFLNYTKTATSTNPAIDLLLQRVQTDFKYSKNTSTARRGRRPGSDSDYVNSDQSRIYSGGVRYSLTPKDPPSWTKWRPLDSMRAKWLPEKIREIELTFLPKNASLNLANASFTSSEEHRFESEVTRSDRYTRSFSLNHGLQFDFAPVNPMIDLSYSIAVNREFPNDILEDIGGKEYTFMRNHIIKRNDDNTWRDYYILDQERSRSQKFKMVFNPQIFEWLTNSADYSANYDGSMTKWGSDNSTEYINAKVSSTVSFNSSLTTASLLKVSKDSSGLSKFISGAKKGCDFIGFNSVNFTYSMSSDLKNNYLGSGFLSGNNYKQRTSASDFLAYQLGVKDRSPSEILAGDMDDRMAFGGMRYRSENKDVYDYYKNDNRTVSRNYSISTGLGISKPIDFQLSSISLKWSKRYTMLPDTNYYDTSSTFPEFGIGARTSVLEKISLLNKFVQGMSLSSNYSFKKGRAVSSSSGGDEVITRGYDLSPLVSVDGTLRKWPVRFSYQHTLGHDERRQKIDTVATNRNGDNIEVNYEIPAPAEVKKINFFKWSIPIKGKTAMAMSISRDRSKTVTKGSTTDENSNFSVKPHISYDFTNNVTGRLEYTGSRSSEMGGRITTSNIFGGVAEIRF